MPAAFYKILKAGGAAHPVLLTRTSIIETAEQVRAHFLCDSCEHRFNRRGEDWVIRTAGDRPSRFPFTRFCRPRLDLALTRRTSGLPGSSRAERQGGADCVFRRQRVLARRGRRWGSPPDDHHIDLGPYLEPLRRYLLDEQPFPDRMGLTVMLTAAPGDLTNLVMSLPYQASKHPFHMFRFDVPGIGFYLITGGGIPEENIRNCAVRTGTIVIATAADELRRDAIVSNMRTAKPRGTRPTGPHATRWRMTLFAAAHQSGAD